MKLKLLKPSPGDKSLEIISESRDFVLRVDYDDVDHESVMKSAKELVKIVNNRK